MTLREVIRKVFNKTINEKITKAQQEIGQREMNKIYSDPFIKLNEWFNEEWKNKPKNKIYFLQKQRIDFLNKAFNEQKNKSNEEIQNYLKSVNGQELKAQVLKGNGNGVYDNNGKILPQLFIDPTFQKSAKRIINGICFKLEDNEFLELCLRRFLILHEYGHLFEYMKDYVLYGKAKIIKTLADNIDEVQCSEGKANDYAIKNSYRKDILYMFLNSELTDKELNQQVIDRLKDMKRNKETEKDANDIINYRTGTAKYSESFKDKLKTINNPKGVRL